MGDLEGTLEKRGAPPFRLWQEVKLHLQEKNHLSVFDKSGKAKESLYVAHCVKLSSNKKGEEYAFELHFTGKKEKMTLRAPNEEELGRWTDTIKANLEDLGHTGTFNYGLPPNDPRTDLPLISVPEEFANNFGYLNMAVVHWFGVVKKLGVGFSVEERIAVLGDRCLYMCKRNADITRCVMVSDIKNLLLAQDDAKDLYIAIIMPNEIPNKHESDKPARVEYDLMFHSSEIQTFVRYLRTVYVYQTGGQTLPLDQVRDKGQLETDVRLARPKGWELTYWQPMFKEHLAQLLDTWQKQQSEGGAPTPEHQQGAGGGASDPQRAKSIEGPGAASAGDSSLDDSDPLAKFLVILSLSKYYSVMRSSKMTLETLVSGLIDDSDLQHFGVESEADRRTIIRGLQDKQLIERLTQSALYSPPEMPATKEKKQELDDDFAGAKPKLADDDDLDLDLDFGDFGGASKPAAGGSNGFALEDFDLDDFAPVPVSKNAINLDDLDELDLGSPPPAKPAGAVDLDFDDLSPPTKKAPVGDLDDLDLDLSPAPAKSAALPDLDDL
ncbi:Tcc1i14-2.7 [Diplonema papillatum]|nr:Tcc1i14-2.7 [Diplonema papillatum]